MDIFRVNTGEKIASVISSGFAVRGVVTSNDGRMVYVIHDDGTIAAYDWGRRIQP